MIDPSAARTAPAAMRELTSMSCVVSGFGRGRCLARQRAGMRRYPALWSAALVLAGPLAVQSARSVGVDEREAPIWPQRGYDPTHHARSPYQGPSSQGYIRSMFPTKGNGISDYPGASRAACGSSRVELAQGRVAGGIRDGLPQGGAVVARGASRALPKFNLGRHCLRTWAHAGDAETLLAWQ